MYWSDSVFTDVAALIGWFSGGACLSLNEEERRGFRLVIEEREAVSECICLWSLVPGRDKDL